MKGGINKMLKYKNKRGQMFMIGILILTMSLIVLISVTPAINSVADSARGCSNLNCDGYVDRDAQNIAGCSSGNQSYLPSGNKNALSCTILDLALPFTILGTLIGLITALLHGRLVDKPEPQYGGYPGY